LSAAAGYVNGIGLDPSNVYFVTGEGGQVARCAIAGCNGSAQIVYSDSGHADSLYYDSTKGNIYFTDGTANKIYSVTTGGALNYAISLALSTTPTSPTSDGSYLYWGQSGGIGRANIADGTNVTTLVPIANGYPSSVWFDAASGYIFATNSGRPGTLYECDRGGACSTFSSPSYFDMVAVVVQGSTVLFGTGGDGSNSYAGSGVFSAPVSSISNVTTLVESLSYAYVDYMTADSTNVYFHSAINGSIYKCALSGCSQTPTIVVKNPGQVASLANDSTFLYYGIYQQVMRVAK
jgi:hypothetical protein